MFCYPKHEKKRDCRKNLVFDNLGYSFIGLAKVINANRISNFF